MLVATFHEVDDGRVCPAVARLGESPHAVCEDPLLCAAVASGDVCTVSDGTDGASLLVAAVPLADAHGRTRAVVAVRELHFSACHDENFRLLAVLGGHLGDEITRLDVGRDVVAVDSTRTLAAAALPHGASAREFLYRLERCLLDRRRHELPATLVALRVSAGDGVRERVAASRRELDATLIERASDGGEVLCLLLPLTDEAGADRYIVRVLGDRVRERATLHPLRGDEVPATLLDHARRARRDDPLDADSAAEDVHVAAP